MVRSWGGCPAPPQEPRPHRRPPAGGSPGLAPLRTPGLTEASAPSCPQTPRSSGIHEGPGPRAAGTGSHLSMGSDLGGSSHIFPSGALCPKESFQSCLLGIFRLWKPRWEVPSRLQPAGQPVRPRATPPEPPAPRGPATATAPRPTSRPLPSRLFYKTAVSASGSFSDLFYVTCFFVLHVPRSRGPGGQGGSLLPLGAPPAGPISRRGARSPGRVRSEAPPQRPACTHPAEVRAGGRAGGVGPWSCLRGPAQPRAAARGPRMRTVARGQEAAPVCPGKAF